MARARNRVVEAIYAPRNSYSAKVTQRLLRSCVCRKPHIMYSEW